MAQQRVISPLAQLIMKMQGQMGSVSGYDPQLAADIQAAQYGKSDLDRGYESTAQEAKISFDEMKQQLQENKVRGYENNEGTFSGNGLLRSGIFAKEQGRVGEEFQGGINSALQRRQQMIQQAADARLSGYNQLSSGLAQSQAGAAQRATEAARQAELQRVATQQQQALLGIQQQGLAQQKSYQQQQLDLYRQQMSRTGSSIPNMQPAPSAAARPSAPNPYAGWTGPASIYGTPQSNPYAGQSGPASVYGAAGRAIAKPPQIKKPGAAVRLGPAPRQTTNPSRTRPSGLQGPAPMRRNGGR